MQVFSVGTIQCMDGNVGLTQHPTQYDVVITSLSPSDVVHSDPCPIGMVLWCRDR